MIERELEKIVRDQKERGAQDAFIRNALKEYLQVYLLYFIYTSPQYRQNLIFTGGTCLRHFYGLERLSEDVDFDVPAGFVAADLSEDLKTFFGAKYQYRDLEISLKQKGRQILLKFPVLKKLGLAEENESDLLHVKMDLSQIPSENYSVVTSSKSVFGMNFAARHYDLPSLMAGKLHAILTRKHLKGRDYFDLLWFVKKGVCPDIRRLSDMLGIGVDLKTVEIRVDEKVTLFMKKHRGDYRVDMAPLIADPAILEIMIDDYENEYLRSRAQSFSDIVKLGLVCQNCGQKFSSGISIERETFKNLKAIGNAHRCPFCRHENRVEKSGYVIL